MIDKKEMAIEILKDCAGELTAHLTGSIEAGYIKFDEMLELLRNIRRSTCRLLIEDKEEAKS